MGPDYGAVDHLDLLRYRLAFIERIEDQYPQPGQRPPPELAIDTRPFTELLWKVTPLGAGSGYPEYAVENQP